MASLKREEEYRINHDRLRAMKRGFRTAFWLTMIPSAGVFIALVIYYFIRGLALMAGISMILGEYYAADGGTVESPLFFDTPYLYMAFLFVIGLSSFLGFFFRVKKPFLIALVLYIIGAAYGLIGLFMGICGIAAGLYFLAYGGYGVWLFSVVMSLHKEKEYLSMQEGYPDFIVVIDEPRPMANTSGLYYKQSEYIKRQRKEKSETEESENQSWEMEELPLDAELPKSNRKIDNMM